MKGLLKSIRSQWQTWIGVGALGALLCMQMLVLPSRGYATESPQAVVNQFYQWYVQNQLEVREKISQQQAVFDPVLYQQLVKAFQKGPQDGEWLDIDPFSATQVSTFKAVVKPGKPTLPNPRLAEVDVEVFAGLRPPGNPVSIKVLLGKPGDRWQIRNLVYLRSWNNLLCELKLINRSTKS